MSDATAALAAFHRAFFGPIDQYLAWHDGFDSQTDLASLDALPPPEQAQAATELLAALRAGIADARALLGLGHLRHAEALPLLHDCLRRGFYSSYALEAIAQIDPAGLYPLLVAQQLHAKATATHQLIDLLVGLREFFTLPQLGPLLPPLVFALLAHPDYLVRYHALETLRRLYGVPTAAQQQDYSQQCRQADVIFGLITQDRCPANFGKAQRLLLAELPAATLASFPLATR